MIAHAFASLLGNPAGLLITKVTIVLTAACVASALAKELSAARRHLLFVAALSSCVWLALSSPLVPAIVIHAPISPGSVVAAASPSSIVAHSTSSGDAMPGLRATEARFASTRGARRVGRWPIPSPSHPLFVFWVIGCVVLLGRHAIGLAAALRLARRARIASDDATMREIASAAVVVGVRRTVRLGYSTGSQSPITFGIARPLVLFPIEAQSWSIECRRAVLLHEIAHIARGDWLSQTICRLARDLFWFHPLAWRAFAHVRDEAERAADDCVVGSGMPVVNYASHILDVARRTSNVRPSLAAVGIISNNDLERRFVAMFDAARSRRLVTTRTQAVAASVLLAVVSPFASLHVAAYAAAAAAPRVSPPTSAPATKIALFGDASRAADTTRTYIASALPVSMVLPPVERPRPIVVVGDSARRGNASARPDFSGKWRQDTVAGPLVDSYVTDSTIITQSENAISIEPRGHFLYEPTHNRFLTIPFGGAGIQGVTVTGSDTASVIASALWYGDTLVVDTHANGGTTGGAYIHTIERLTLSPDGNTLFADNLSYVGGRYRWGGPRTFVLRRAMP
jgi:beta-lactamase regulating signal transducer with metallopeptidase domain